ncbi:AfsR/SARP family transcriptional regulator [Actinophytocola sp.]|uniref:AfsR/SARP family transcriptional regulator n=1 Tax=Actinophytocola sp. TaxID=1872138 RepID=UPI003D6AFE9C
MRAEINVLGSLEVAINGVPVVPTASKPRQLLAMLAINAGRLVTSTALMDELWGDRTPRSAPSTLQTYVLHVRNLIRAALPDDQAQVARDLLTTGHTGYLLQVEPELVDATRYTRLSSGGRVAGAAGDYVKAEGLLSSALALWRGPVLVDVAAGPQLEIEAMRLEESRLTDLTLRIDADLHLGRHHQLLGDLAALCARHPFMENFRAQYMLALYRSGRPGQALEVYHDMWATIRDQLGVDPSPRLRQLHRAILTGDTIIDAPRFMVNTWVPDAVAG